MAMFKDHFAISSRSSVLTLHSLQCHLQLPF